MKKYALLFPLMFLMLVFPLLSFAQTIVGQWSFDNPADLLNATVGNDLELVGTQTVVPGPDTNDGAVNIGVGSYYKANHGIPANGGGTMVNEYSVVIDFKIASLGQWYTFMQTYYPNTNDGDAFINPSGQIGVAATGYSAYSVLPNEWYRLVIAIDLGSSYKYYLDGQLLQDGGVQTVDGRFSVYPANPAEPFLFFADENAEDNPINVAYCAMYNGCLTSTQVTALGGYGHSILPPSAEMLPYLQTPAPTSMYVCWHGASADESRVEYGTTSNLGMSQTGTVYTFNSTTKWHSVKLENLTPATEYFYQCHTGTQTSSISSFRTSPSIGSREGHFRFLIMGDSQSNAGVSANIVNHVNLKLTELYGLNWQNEVQLLCHVGDAVANGINLNSYITEHFIPFSPLTAKIPIMEAIGNHEVESTYYYNYKKYEDIGGQEGEKYYHFDLGPMRFLFLNPNISTTTESTWLQTKITEAQDDENKDWIFTFSHMPAWSEIWPDGNDTWAQNTVIPALSASDKAAILASGHSHNYERGVSPTGKLTTLISGGAGGTLDRWGMYNNQQDYLNTIKSMDQYHWILVDVDMENRSYSAKMYSLGNPELPRNNEVMDEWTVINPSPNGILSYLGINNAVTGGPMRLTALSDCDDAILHSTRLQIATDTDFNNIIHDVTRSYTNIYGDSGNPFWTPVDLNASIDLWRYAVPDGILQEGNTYRWRLTERNKDLQWNLWHNMSSFEMNYQQPAADFAYLSNLITQADYVRFIEGSVGVATSFAWDFESDGTIDSVERDPRHTFPGPGTYNTTLTVTINGQSYSHDQSVIVHYVSGDDNTLPLAVNILSVYPNPFKIKANISLNLAKSTMVTLDIFNLKGELVRKLEVQTLPKGKHNLVWDGCYDNGTPAPTGVYLLRAQTGRQSQTQKVLLLK